MKELGKRTTIICLAATTIAELYLTGEVDASILLWIGYGIWKAHE